MHPLTTRLFGAFTAAYGLYALTRPLHLARQVGLDPDIATRVGRVLGVRDVASGAVIGLASAPAARAGLVVRAAFDAIDAVAFGTLAPTPSGRRKGAGAAVAWGSLAVALLLTGPRADHGGRG